MRRMNAPLAPTARPAAARPPAPSVGPGAAPLASAVHGYGMPVLALLGLALLLWLRWSDSDAALLHSAGGAHEVRLLLILNRWGAQAPMLWSSLSVLGLGLSAWLLLLMLLRPERPHHARVQAALIWCLPIGGLLTHLPKQWLGWPRPAAVLGESLQVIGQPLFQHAMPSGHALTAFTVAALCSLGRVGSRPLRLSLWLLAMAVALSRVVVGAHWPGDVLAGAALGLLCAWLGYLAAGQGGLPHWLARRSARVAAALLLAAGGVTVLGLKTGYPQAATFQLLLGLAAVGVATVRVVYWVGLYRGEASLPHQPAATLWRQIRRGSRSVPPGRERALRADTLGLHLGRRNAA